MAEGEEADLFHGDRLEIGCGKAMAVLLFPAIRHPRSRMAGLLSSTGHAWSLVTCEFLLEAKMTLKFIVMSDLHLVPEGELSMTLD
ncbi:hypothetical protein, partial [Devosia sp.]|uniref:hypothetical protein n=1 Tax=Devosia sp. TaxID=1871048 RepID=UPI001AC298EC